jgi:hypothetical protein
MKDFYFVIFIPQIWSSDEPINQTVMAVISLLSFLPNRWALNAMPSWDKRMLILFHRNMVGICCCFTLQSIIGEYLCQKESMILLVDIQGNHFHPN